MADSRNIMERGGTPAQPLQVSPLLSPEQNRALDGLLAGLGPTQAAKQAGVGRTTLYRWMTGDPNFIAARNLALREMADVLRQRRRLLACESVEVLHRLVRARKTPIPVKAKIALAVLAMEEGDEPPGPADPIDAQIEINKRDQRQTSAQILYRPVSGRMRGQGEGPPLVERV
jgi:hypothetical protein